MDWIKIDNHGFNVKSVQAMDEQQFVDQYKDHKPLHLTEKEWMKWCKDAYSTIAALNKPLKPKKEKPAP